MQKLFSATAVLFLGLILCSANIFAQEDSTPKIPDVGIVNGKASKLVIPLYPAAAKAVNASGAVNVQVIINESGDVISATSVSGHPLLRLASENAALESKFTPVKIDGQNVRVRGIIVYNFVPSNMEKASELKSDTVNIEIINGKALKLVLPEYPPAAKSVNASGAVSVEATLNEKGEVVAAKSVSGHPLLREAAEKAALQSKFAPTMVEGKAVRSTGIIVYNFVADEFADEPEAFKTAKTFGVINGKAINLPAPEYPAAAKAVNASGAVSVKVLVDEKGNVVYAKVTNGHPLLRQAAETAAKKATFSPFMVDGKAINVKGAIVYNFVSSGKVNKTP